MIEIRSIFGEYDLLPKIESVGYESIGEIVVNMIRTIEGITNTQTLATIDY